MWTRRSLHGSSRVKWSYCFAVRPRDVRPERAVCEHDPARCGRERGVRAERVDDEVERADALAAARDHARLCASPIQPLDALAGHDLDGAVANRVVQHVEQRGAMDRERSHIRSQSAVTHVEHDALGRRRASVQPLDRRAEGGEAFAHAECVEHCEPGRLQDEPGAKRARRIELIEEPDAMAVAREQQGRCETRGPAAADGDVERCVLHSL
jgi:hypothetical protein